MTAPSTSNLEARHGGPELIVLREVEVCGGLPEVGFSSDSRDEDVARFDLFDEFQADRVLVGIEDDHGDAARVQTLLEDLSVAVTDGREAGLQESKSASPDGGDP